MNKKQMKQYIDQWEHANEELEKIRRDELQRLEYDPAMVSALLDIGDRFGQSRPTSGMVEMQRLFMKLAEKEGLLPPSTRENPSEYKSKPGKTSTKKIRMRKSANK